MVTSARRLTLRPLLLPLAFLSLSTLTLSAVAHAQTDTAAAEALFREGRKLLEDKRIDEACPKLAESYRLDPATGALLALAICHEAQGKTASAWSEYNDAASRSRREGRDDRAKAAADSARALEPRLSRLLISVAPGVEATPGLVVKRDSTTLGQGAWGTPIPVDPGEHTIEASAPNRATWRTTVTLAAKPAKIEVVVPALAESAPAPVPPVVSPSEPLAAAGSSRPVSSTTTDAFPAVTADGLFHGPWRTAGIVAGGVGVIGVAVGTVFGIRAMGKKQDSSSLGCQGNACPPDAKSTRQDALHAANISTVGFIAGGALLAGGVTLYVLAPKLESRSGTEVRVGAVGASGTGVVVFRSF